MTEKRFTIGDRVLQEVYAGCIPAILDGKIPCTQSQVLKLLNELYDENEELKQRTTKLENEIKDFQDILSSKEELCLKRVNQIIDEQIDEYYQQQRELEKGNKDSGRFLVYSVALARLKKEINK